MRLELRAAAAALALACSPLATPAVEPPTPLPLPVSLEEGLAAAQRPADSARQTETQAALSAAARAARQAADSVAEGDGAVAAELAAWLRASSAELAVATGAAVQRGGAAVAATLSEQGPALVVAAQRAAANTGTRAAQAAVAIAEKQLEALDEATRVELSQRQQAAEQAAATARRAAVAAQQASVAAAAEMRRAITAFEASEFGKELSDGGLFAVRDSLRAKVAARFEYRAKDAKKLADILALRASEQMSRAQEVAAAELSAALRRESLEAEAAMAAAVAAWEATASDAIALAPPEAREALLAGGVEARRLLVRYAPEVQAALTQASRGSSSVAEALLAGLQQAPLPEFTSQPQGLLAKALSQPMQVGSIKLRVGMPLTELSPQLPQLAGEVAKLGEQLVDADGGGALLDELARAAAAGTKTATELYVQSLASYAQDMRAAAPQLAQLAREVQNAASPEAAARVLSGLVAWQQSAIDIANAATADFSSGEAGALASDDLARLQRAISMLGDRGKQLQFDANQYLGTAGAAAVADAIDKGMKALSEMVR